MHRSGSPAQPTDDFARGDDTTEFIAIAESRAGTSRALAAKRRIEEAIEAGKSTIIVDLSSATSLDATMLGVLAAGHERLSAEGGDLVVISAHPGVCKMFEMTRLDDELRVVATPEEAAKVSPRVSPTRS